MQNIQNTGSKLITTPDQIREAAKRCEIDLDAWEKGTYTMDHLLQTLREDSVSLEDAGSELILHVKNSVVYVWYGLPACLLELKESRQIHFKTGQIVTRNFRGISKTLHLEEKPEDGAKRALAEEPGYSEPGFRDPANYKLFYMFPQIMRKPSEKWNGLTAEFNRKIYGCYADKKIYDPEGYFEITEKDGVATMRTDFAWIQV